MRTRTTVQGDGGSREVFNEERLKDRMERLGAIVRDTHAVYANWDHGSVYVEKRLIFMHPWAAEDFAGCLANRFDAHEIDMVVGPGEMGAILSRDVAKHLSFDTTQLIHCACAHKNKRGHLEFKSLYRRALKSKRVLVVYDVLRTCSTINDLIALVESCGGIVVGAGTIVDQRKPAAQLVHAPRLECLLYYDFPSYSADTCPLCAADVPINTELGHGLEFVERRTEAQL